MLAVHGLFIQRIGSPQATYSASTKNHLQQLNGDLLVHLSDELVDVGLPVAEITALDEVLEFPYSPATSWVGELEWPEEVGDLRK